MERFAKLAIPAEVALFKVPERVPDPGFVPITMLMVDEIAVMVFPKVS